MNKVIWFLFLFSTVAYSHGDLHQRIEEISNEIIKHPDSAFLFVKRGKLYYQHESFKKSLKDLIKSESLRYRSPEQQLLFAKNYFRLNRFKKSLSIIDTILITDSYNVNVIKLKARIFFKQGHFKKAALMHEKVIEYTSKTFPENYIDASIAWEFLNTKEGLSNAYLIVNKGISDLGEINSLYNRLISLATVKKDYDYAIKMQLKTIELSPRKERGYYNLSKLYFLKNEFSNSKESLILARQHFNKLPLRIKNTSFMKELLEKIKTQETLLKVKFKTD